MKYVGFLSESLGGPIITNDLTPFREMLGPEDFKALEQVVNLMTQDYREQLDNARSEFEELLLDMSRQAEELSERANLMADKLHEFGCEIDKLLEREDFKL